MTLKSMKIIRREDQTGAAAVEFAVVLPLLMLLVCGIIEFGALLHNKQVVVNASREAARAGITGEADLQLIARNYCGGQLIGLSEAITADMVDVTAVNDGTDLTVHVQFAYTLLFGNIIDIDQVTVAGETVMRMEPPL